MEEVLRTAAEELSGGKGGGGKKKKGKSRGTVTAYDESDGLEEELCYAAATGDIGLMETLLFAYGVDVDACDPDNEDSVLIWASRALQVDAVLLLVENAADVNYEDPHYGTTALLAACAGNLSKEELSEGADKEYDQRIECVEILIEEGADVNHSRFDGQTAAHIAALAGHTAIIEILIEEGAILDICDENGNTPLDYAVKKKHHDCANAIRQSTESAASGPSTTSKGSKNKSKNKSKKKKKKAAAAAAAATAATAVNTNAQIVRYNPSHLKPTAALPTAFFDFTFVTWIPSGEAKQAPKGIDHLLHRAAFAGEANEVKRLIVKEKINPNVQDPDDGWTPLHYAAFYLQPTTIKMLVESKANVNIIDKDNATPLSYACGVLTKYIPDGHFRLYAVVATLLFYGADVNVARLSNGWTPLHYAAFHGRTHLVDLLTNAHANTTGKNKQGKTAIELALEGGHTACADIIRTKATSSSSSSVKKPPGVASTLPVIPPPAIAPAIKGVPKPAHCCPTHPIVAVSGVCGVCLEAVCPSCVSSANHKNHTILPVQEGAAKLASLIRGHTRSLQAQSGKLTAKASAHDKAIKQLSAQLDDVKSKITNEFNAILAQLLSRVDPVNSRRDSLLDTARGMFRDDVDEFGFHRDKLQIMHESAFSLCNEADQLIRHLQASPNVETKLANLHSSKGLLVRMGQLLESVETNANALKSTAFSFTRPDDILAADISELGALYHH